MASEIPTWICTICQTFNVESSELCTNEGCRRKREVVGSDLARHIAP